MGVSGHAVADESAPVARKLVKASAPGLRRAGADEKLKQDNESVGGASFQMASIDNSEGRMPKQSGLARVIVMGAIALISAAFFVGTYLQFRWPFWTAAGATAALCTVLILFDALRRRFENEQVLFEAVTQLEDEVDRLREAPTPPPAARAGFGGAADRLPGMRASSSSAAPASPFDERSPAMPPPIPSLGTDAKVLGKGKVMTPDELFAAGNAKPALKATAAGKIPVAGAKPAANAAPTKPFSPLPPPKPLPVAEQQKELPLGQDLPRVLNRDAGPAAPPVPSREPSLMSERPGAPHGAEHAGALSAKLESKAAPKLPPAKPAAKDAAAKPTAPPLPKFKLDAAAPSLPDWSVAPPPPAAAVASRPFSSSSKPSLPELQRAEPPTLSSDRDADLDEVHGMIKRLAEEVDISLEPTLDGLPPQRQESVLRASLNALQTTANAMRASKKKDGGAAPPPITPSHTRIASLADAVTAGRIDVAIAPVVGIADRRVHYHEVLARPCDERGVPLSASTREPQLAVAGLLPLLDSARLRRAADVARAFADKGREPTLFVPITAVSLANDGFLDELADAYQERASLANEVVLTFAQADVRTFGDAEWSALTDMRDLGFRFGIEAVTDFDGEFAGLEGVGFGFVKVDAVTLIAGLDVPSGSMPASEVCTTLASYGLTLIVNGVDNEALRGKVAASGVVLGQGSLFGEPKTVAGVGYAARTAAA
ncbi:hypothetical protein C6Y62_01105 [Hyphomicrobium sulfonivorans]|nr:hypothetical protein [Hyphomicrobium sulfonivorans]